MCMLMYIVCMMRTPVCLHVQRESLMQDFHGGGGRECTINALAIPFGISSAGGGGDMYVCS